MREIYSDFDRILSVFQQNMTHRCHVLDVMVKKNGGDEGWRISSFLPS